MDQAVANRYVSALAEVVTQQDSALSPEEALEQLEAFGEVLEESVDLAAVLHAPSIQPSEKRALIAELGRRLNLAPLIVNFLSVVTEHRRMGHYSVISDGFRKWLDGHRNRVEVQVRSAAPFSADQKAELEGRFRELTGKEIRAIYSEDPSLIGGSAVQVGSTLYDGSLRAALGSLANRLATGNL